MAKCFTFTKNLLEILEKSHRVDWEAWISSQIDEFKKKNERNSFSNYTLFALKNKLEIKEKFNKKEISIKYFHNFY